MKDRDLIMNLIGKLFFLFCISFRVHAGYISVDKTFIDGLDFINLTVTLEGDEELVSIENISRFNIESTSNSSSYKYINGKASREKSIIYSLSLKDSKKTNMVIGPAIIKSNGKNIKTNKVILKINSGEKAKKDRDYFLQLKSNRKTVMVNESIMIKLKFYNRARLVEAQVKEPSSEDYFLDQVGKEKNFREVINGKEFQVSELIYQLTPLRSGELTFPGFELNGLAVIQDNRARGFGGFFNDDFFSSSFGKRKRIRVKSNSLQLNVENFPERGKPNNFNGLVGDFELKQSLTKNPSNNSYRLNIKIIGEGDLSTLEKLSLKSSLNYTIYEESDKGLGDLGKSFSLVIIPKKNGVFKLHTERIPFFSIKSKNYEHLEFGGQELIFSGVDESSSGQLEKFKTNPARQENEKALVKENDAFNQAQDILLVPRTDFLRKFIDLLFLKRFYLIFAYLIVFILLIFRSKVFNLFKIEKKSEQRQLNKKFQDVFEMSSFEPSRALNWLNEFSNHHSGKRNQVGGAQFIKESSKVDENIKTSIDLLERSCFGRHKLEKSDRELIIREFKKLKEMKELR